MRIYWVTQKAEIEPLVRLFIENTDPIYISHGEIQCGRAISLDEWAPNLTEVLTAEFMELVAQSFAGANWRGLMAAVLDNKHVGLIVASVTKEQKGEAFATLEDIVVAQALRGKGIAAKMFAAFEDYLHEKKIFRIFLESAVRNQRVHATLHQLGFETCSVVMTKALKVQ